MLFLDEIGELHPMQMNKLLKVLEDRKVMLDSAYYSESDRSIPRHIHDIFKNGLPADFRLVAATTRRPEELPPALRSRCMEINFRALTAEETALIARNAAKSAGFTLEAGCDELIGRYSPGGRDAANLVQVGAGLARNDGRKEITIEDIQYVLRTGSYAPRMERSVCGGRSVGRVNGLAVTGGGSGAVLDIEAAAFPTHGKLGVWRATGIVEQEQLDAGARKMVRRSTASGAVENVRTALRLRGIDVDGYDVHIDFPGGMPVDGPSAGVAMAVVVYSAITGQAVDGSIALTGEVGIGGAVLPVGGVSEKVRAAVRGGARLVLIPRENEEKAFERMEQVRCIDTLDDALRICIGEETAQQQIAAAFAPASAEVLTAQKA